MKISRLILINALLFVALGSGFALYAPLMLPLYGILESEGRVGLYWYTVSFARLLGAALFGCGFLLWALHREVETIPPERQRRLASSIAVQLYPESDSDACPTSIDLGHSAGMVHCRGSSPTDIGLCLLLHKVR